MKSNNFKKIILFCLRSRTTAQAVSMLNLDDLVSAPNSLVADSDSGEEFPRPVDNDFDDSDADSDFE